jgi:hypothetical protein
MDEILSISDRTNRVRFLTLVVALTLCCDPGGVFAQALQGTVFQRVSRASNYEFAVYNNGLLWGSIQNFYNPAGWPWKTVGYWPRGSFHMDADVAWDGFSFLAKKNSKLLVSGPNIPKWPTLSFGPFREMVPGRIGDPKAAFDPDFAGPGWRYVDDPDYIVYSSLDYDSLGIDRSGNNYNDWPIRMVNGHAVYVPEPLERPNYPPVYSSDEDMFCVFKDTDTRADDLYSGPGGPSFPIGVEVQSYIYTWGTGPAKDIVVFRYEITNKSDTVLDSCFIAFNSGAALAAPGALLTQRFDIYHGEPWRDLVYQFATIPDQWKKYWYATPNPPTIGYSLLETPRGYTGLPVRLTHAWPQDTIHAFQGQDSVWYGLEVAPSDSIIYRNLTTPPVVPYRFAGKYSTVPLLISGPFRMLPGDTVRYVMATIFADSLAPLIALDDYVRHAYSSGFKRPTPPPTPRLLARGLNRSVRLSWDNVAEGAVDEFIPDSLGRPFLGYRLLRAQTQQGPYSQIGRWVRDSLLVHEYLDRGEDLAGGLKNNVRYYYRLLSFDEGAKKLKLDPMDSPPVEGVNSVSVVPGVEPSNATSSPSDGSLASGILGDVSVPRLIPTSPTNFNNLISGRTLQVTLNASTDGTRYTIPVTIRDTVAGRVQNAIVDPGLFVHGSTARAGVKQGTGLIKDIFGIGAADVSIAYSFEQLADSFHIVPAIVSTQGADVPVVVTDSLGATGVETITPYTTAPKEIEVEFTGGGIDTISTLFHRYVPYLAVRVREEGRELVSDTEYTFAPRGIRRTGGTSFAGKHSRYYLSGVISNGEEWDWGATLSMYESRIGFDYTDHGVGSGKASPYFSWASPHRSGTRDFQAGDKVTIRWQGGVQAVFPRQATVLVEGAPGGRAEVTDAMMEGIRIVPNPYMIRHEAQRGSPVLYFNYLPQECTIRIYTVALDLVKTIRHSEGSREEWNLQTEGGQLVASQMLIAHIETNSGKQVTKKFAVVMGE